MDKQLKKFMQAVKELERAYAEEVSFKGKYGESVSHFYKNIKKGNQGIRLRKEGEKYELTLWQHHSTEVYEELVEDFNFLNSHNQGLLACVYDHLDEKKQKEREELRKIENQFYASPIDFNKPSLISSLLVKRKQKKELEVSLMENIFFLKIKKGKIKNKKSFFINSSLRQSSYLQTSIPKSDISLEAGLEEVCSSKSFPKT